MSRPFNANAIVDQLAAIYEESVANLRQALARYVEDRTPPDHPAAEARARSLIPSCASIMPASAASLRRPARSPGSISPAPMRPASPGPSCSANIWSSSSSILNRDYDVKIRVGRSASEIPYAYVIENSGIQVGDIGTAELSRFFPSNELVHLGDEIADGVWESRRSAAAAGAVRWSAHRLQPGAAAALYRHAVRAFPAVRAVHQLCPLRRRVRRASRSTRSAAGNRASPRCRCRARCMSRAN